MSAALPARKTALYILDAVLSRRQPLDAALDTADFADLDARDRAFVRMLTATTLRRLGQIDDVLRRASEREDAPEPVLLHHLLRLGVTQLLFMDVPDYAAVDTAVRLTEDLALKKKSGFVNAVLRHVSRKGPEWLREQDGAALNVPGWLARAWEADYGEETARAIAAASLEEAPLDITLAASADGAGWAARLDAAVLPWGTLRRAAGGAVPELPGYDEGAWWVQDAAASLPVRLLGAFRGKTVLDLCAAPGGKTAQLASGGANVVAIDRSAGRLKRLRANMTRLQIENRVRTVAVDALSWEPDGPFGPVLLDAPCSATGTIRRNPDVMRLKTPQDVATLTQTQARLLDRAVELLPPGERLVYCTCSLQKDEGERQIERLLQRDGSIRRVPVTAQETGGMTEILTPEGDIRALPCHMRGQGGLDGFYIARLERIAG